MAIWNTINTINWWLYLIFFGVGLVGLLVFLIEKITGKSNSGSREVLPVPQRIQGNCPLWIVSCYWY